MTDQQQHVYAVHLPLELWLNAKSEAAKRQESVRAVIIRALKAYTGGAHAPDPTRLSPPR